MKKLSALLLTLFASLAYADPFASTASTAAGQPSSLPSILMLVVFVVIFYFLLIRPQMKRSKDQRQLLNVITKGDEIVTASGIYGKVNKVDDSTIELEIADNVIVKVQKQAIASMLPKGTVSASS